VAEKQQQEKLWLPLAAAPHYVTKGSCAKE